MGLSEYLIFNLVVFIPPFLFGLMERFSFKRQYRAAFIAIALIVPWFVIWDSLVTDRHWWFNSKYVLGISLFGLPIEELLFFITVPFACLFTWEMLLRRIPARSQRIPVVFTAVVIMCSVLGSVALNTGREYTALALGSLVISAVIDFVLKTRLLQQPRFLLYLLVVVLFTLIFNGYLTARPVVLYDPQYQLNFRIITIPVEDFVYGIALIIACASVFERLKSHGEQL